MSSLGPIPNPLVATPLASSFAGAQRVDPIAGRAKAEARQQDAAHSRNQASAQSLEDVEKSTASSDRDADGRMPEGSADEPSPGQNDGEAIPTHTTGLPSPDVLGERGRAIDFQA